MSFLVFILLLVCLLAGLFLVALRFLHRGWWNNRRVRWLALTLPVAGILGAVTWWMTPWGSTSWLRSAAMLVTGIALVFELAMVLTLPLAALVRLVGRLILKYIPSRSRSKTAGPVEVDRGRRRALEAMAAVVPIGTLALGAGGFGQASGKAHVYERTIKLAGLPDELKGLKIFHLSDLHLGPFIKLDDLEETLSQAEKYAPDLILVTGDIADDVPVLGDALRLIDQLHPRLGSIASLGNHEHFRGLKEITRIINNSPVRLMVNESAVINIGQASLALAAIDDPRSMGRDHTSFFNTTLDQALGGVRSEDTIVLMSHRPSVFPQASDRGVDLTLSGHTHGGQVGLMGRSVFELAGDAEYLWGEYTLGDSRLYTSSGMGHWFPFRLGCPTEAPIIVLG